MTAIVQTKERPSLITLPAYQVVIDGLKSQHSKDAYTRNLTQLDKWLGQTGQQLNRQSLTAWIADLERRKLKPATINQKLAAIRALVRESEISGFIPYDVARPILAIKDRKGTGTVDANWLEKDQIRAILGACDGSVKGIRDKALFAVAIATGLRRAELANLTWQQLKRRRRKWFFMGVQTKGDKSRDVVIQKSAVGHLNDWGKTSGKSGAIFKPVRKNGVIVDKAMTPIAIHKIVASLGEVIDTDLAVHDLRRTYAALLYDNGATVREIQGMLGHSSIQTTERYLKPIRDVQNAKDNYFTF